MAAIFETQRVGSAAVFGSQYTSAGAAPTGAITSIVVSGQTVTISGTTTGTPTSGLATLPAASTPNGAVSQGPTALPLGSGTFTITFTAVEPGNYAMPVVTLTNGSGSNSATGGSTVEVLGIDGEPEAPAPADTTAPVMQGSIAVSLLTSSSYTTGIPAATDNVGVTVYQVSQDGGANWITKGLSRTHDHTGRTPETTDVVMWRAGDAAGLWATPLVVSVDIPPAPGATAPTMNGSLSVTLLTATSYTLSWPAATDAVGVVAYERSLDAGASWLDVGAALSTPITGRMPGSTDAPRVRAYNAAGLRANPALAASVTLLQIASGVAYAAGSDDDDQYIKAVTEPIIRQALFKLQTLLGSTVRVDAVSGALTTSSGERPTGSVAITAPVTITAANAAAFNGRCLQFAAAHTVTLSAGLPADFGFTAMPPSTGNAAIAFAAGATGNGGSAATITRAAGANVTFAVIKDERTPNRFAVTGS